MAQRKQFTKYLKNYGEAEVEALSHFPSLRFNNVLVIPALDETPSFLCRLQRFTHTLVILVINQSDDASPSYANVVLQQFAQTSGETLWRNGNLQLCRWPDDSALLIVDRFHGALTIPRAEGVGGARKIGCDIAAALIGAGAVKSKWIHSSDADAYLPDDYFQQSQRLPSGSAALYNFYHTPAPGKLGEVTALYELSLHYYVAGLRWAGSAYAMHTIGSCIALDAQAYCLARGFPKRAGGEDFYLLNKLRKLAPIHHCQGKAIELEARASSRVPFGTGPAVIKAMSLQDPQREFLSYHPQVFACLRELLQALQTLGVVEELSWQNDLSPAALKAWLALKPDGLYKHLATQFNGVKNVEPRRQAHIHNWFDGFRTLKFIHFLQTHDFPAMPLNEAVALAESALPGFNVAPRSFDRDEF